MQENSLERSRKQPAFIRENNKQNFRDVFTSLTDEWQFASHIAKTAGVSRMLAFGILSKLATSGEIELGFRDNLRPVYRRKQLSAPTPAQE